MQTLVVTNARILTQNPRQPFAEGLVASTSDGRILAIGAAADIAPYREHAGEVLDAGGATITPGFIDTHVHLSVTGLGMLAVNLDGIDAIPALLGRIAAAATGQPTGALLMALNFQAELNPEKRGPTPQELDEVGGGRPVYVMDRSGHMSYVNAAVLDLLGLRLDDTGVGRHADGHFSGLLTDQANTQAFAQLWPRFAEEIGEERAFELAARDAARGGITSLHALDDLASVRRLLACQERLPVRIRPYTQTREVPAVTGLGLKQIGGCGTVMLDGDFDPHTAALLEPYTDRAETSGKLYYSNAELYEYIEEAHRAGLQVALHCVGSAAIEQILNAYEDVLRRYPRANHRHRIEHFELPQAGQAERALRLGVCLALQPSFNHYWPHNQGYPELVGPERAQNVDPLAGPVTLGLPVGLGSDSPVTPLRPLLWLHSAVNHSNPLQRLPVEKALELATLGSSYLAFEEGSKGSLQAGKLADFVLLDRDPTQSPPETLQEIRVLKTVVGGQVVLSAEGDPG